MTSLRLGTGALGFMNPNGLVRPAIEKIRGGLASLLLSWRMATSRTP